MKLSQGGEYLKAETVEKGQTVTFTNAGVIETSDKYKYINKDGTEGDYRKYLVFNVTYKNEPKKLRINTGSKMSLIDAFGDDTEAWVGKRATIHILPVPNGKNKMIVLDPIKETTENATKGLGIAEPAWDE